MKGVETTHVAMVSEKSGEAHFPTRSRLWVTLRTTLPGRLFDHANVSNWLGGARRLEPRRRRSATVNPNQHVISRFATEGV